MWGCAAAQVAATGSLLWLQRRQWDNVNSKLLERMEKHKDESQ